MNNILFAAPLLAVVGLIVMAIKANWVKKQDAGEDKMKKLAGYIKEGALAFLKAEYKMLAVFVVIAGILLGVVSAMVETTHWFIVIAFVIGAVFSAVAGNIGMRIATDANVRTTQAARTSLKTALKVSFGAGTVMGLGVAGLAVFGLSTIFALLTMSFMNEGYDYMSMTIVLESLAGFSLGAESIALFARVGGGIYTKAADVGADLVGKVEAGIPEDDPRNPATIADNVGDNVGDVAGMGADLFGSYVATMLAAMVLGNYVINDHTAGAGMDDTFGGIGPIMLPILIAGLGIIFSIIGTMVVKIKDESAKEKEVQRAFNIGNWGSIILTGIATFFVIDWMLPETLNMTFFGEGSKAVSSMSVFYAVIVGLVVGGLISYLTEYYTAIGKKPVNTIVHNSSTGAATNIIAGLSQGMMSTFFPVLLFAAAIWAAYAFAGFYGVAIAASAMMATTAMQLAIDAFGPIADNAGGIAEMSELPSEVRTRTDILDTVGNTTAATGKGFAIASAALTALALFAAYVTFTGIDGINIFKAPVLAALFVGAMIPVVFSALAMSAVGKAAMAMVKEVRRQFKDIPGIMEGKAEPEYDKCVEISTEASLKEMMLPGLLTIVTPILIAFGTKLFTGDNLLAAEVLGGYMAGVTVSGVMWAIFQNNAGGAWDNAKKSFEAGVMIDGEMTYKGSEAHKAAVTGDTVGDPFKDTSGPSMNILIKLTCLVGLVIAPILGGVHGGHAEGQDHSNTSPEEAAMVTTAAANSGALNGTYEITPDNSQFRWVGKKVTGQHSGTISSRGEANFEDGMLVSGNFDIDMATITVTDIKDAESNADLTGHLKNEDFFDVKNYPSASLRIGGAKMVDPQGVYSFEARLTMKDKTSAVNGEYKLIEVDGAHMLEGGFVFDRAKHDVKFRSGAFFSDLGDKLIYDEVPVSFSVKL